MSTIDSVRSLVRGFATLVRFGWSQLLSSGVCFIWDAILNINEMRMIGANYDYKMFSNETVPANKEWVVSVTKPLFQIFTHFMF